MRLFVCTFLSTSNAAHCDAIGRLLSDRLPGALKPIPKGSAHITYAFLGEVPDEASARIGEKIVPVAANSPGTTVRLGTPVILFGGKEPRLVCLPIVERQAWIEQTARAITEALEGDMPSRLPPKKTKSAHITLARFRPGGRRAARGVQEALAPQVGRAPSEQSIDELQLVRSLLTPEGPEYRVLRRFSLPTLRAPR